MALDAAGEFEFQQHPAHACGGGAGEPHQIVDRDWCRPQQAGDVAAFVLVRSSSVRAALSPFPSPHLRARRRELGLGHGVSCGLRDNLAGRVSGFVGGVTMRAGRMTRSSSGHSHGAFVRAFWHTARPRRRAR